MPEVFVSRWRRRRPLYMSPVISMPIYDDNIDYQIDKSQNQNQCAVIISDNVLRSNSDFVVTIKPKRGRPRKSGRALGVDDVVV